MHACHSVDVEVRDDSRALIRRYSSVVEQVVSDYSCNPVASLRNHPTTN